MSTHKIISKSLPIATSINPSVSSQAQVRKLGRYLIGNYRAKTILFDQNGISVTLPKGTPQSALSSIFNAYVELAPDTNFELSRNPDKTIQINITLNKPPIPDAIVIEVTGNGQITPKSENQCSTTLKYVGKCTALASAIGMLSYSSIIFFRSALEAVGLVEEPDNLETASTHNALATLFATFIYNAEFFMAHGKKIFCCCRRASKVKPD